MIWRLRHPFDRQDYVCAALVTAVALPLFGLAVTQLVPATCHTRGNSELMRWGCLLPGLLIVVPIFLAALIPFGLWINRQRLPDGVLPGVICVGVLTHIALMALYLFFLDNAYRGSFLRAFLEIEQPFVAGALSAAVFWGVLALRQRRRA